MVLVDSPRWPPGPEDVRLLVADRLVPVDCRYVGVSCGLWLWAAIVPEWVTRAEIRGMTAAVLPPKVSVMLDLDLG